MNPEQPLPPAAMLLAAGIVVTLFLLARWVYRDALMNGFSSGAAVVWSVLTFLSLIFLVLYMLARGLRRQRP